MDFVCPRCQHRYQGSDNLVGKEVRCKNAGCQHVFNVVAEEAAVSAATRALSGERAFDRLAAEAAKSAATRRLRLRMAR